MPFYLRRSLEGFPMHTPLDGLGYGIGTICRVLPVGSPVTTYMVRKVTQQCQAVLLSTSGQAGRAGQALLRLLADTLLAIDLEVRPPVHYFILFYLFT